MGQYSEFEVDGYEQTGGSTAITMGCNKCGADIFQRDSTFEGVTLKDMVTAAYEHKDECEGLL